MTSIKSSTDGLLPMFLFASNCSLSVRQLDVLLISAEMRSFSSCVRGIHVSVVGCILTVWVTKGAAIAPRVAREIATFHCFMANAFDKTQATLQHPQHIRTSRAALISERGPWACRSAIGRGDNQKSV